MGCDTSKCTKAIDPIKKVQPMPQQPFVISRTESEPKRTSNVLHPDSDNKLKKAKTMRLKSLNASIKVRPPLTSLPAFTVDAIVLSYLGYEDEIFKLLG